MQLKFIVLALISIYGAQVSESANCRYHQGTISIFSKDVFGYMCEISIDDFSESESLTKIDGKHESSKTDDDIKILKKYRFLDLTNYVYKFCNKFENIEIIEMSENDIETIDEGSLENCGKLRQITFAKNKIRELPEKLLHESPKLIHLSFSGNLIATIPEYLFSNQRKLEYLDMSYNSLRILPQNVFNSIPRLKILWLSKNKIQSLNPNQFEKLRNLQKLNLNYNRISDLPKNIFKVQTFLENLWLSANILTTIHEDSFGERDDLKNVDLSYNRINSIDEDFINDSGISSLDSRGNICCNENLQHRNEINEKLKPCFRNYKPRDNEKSLSKVFDCGKAKIGRQNIIGGHIIQPGAFPWIAALIYTNGKYFCGGTVISNRKVITAALCIQDKIQNMPRSTQEFFIMLGVHDLDKAFETGRITSNVQSIHIHPDLKTDTESYDADIAVLVLEQQIVFNNYIQPICMITPDSDIAEITTGIVVGYGKSQDETKRHENIPKFIETPIHSNIQCFLRNEDLKKISSRRTFCGGYGNGTGVCSGDAGAGFYVSDGNIFYLRGIVSSSLIGGKYGCDIDSYQVYTDILKFIDWINGISN